MDRMAEQDFHLHHVNNGAQSQRNDIYANLSAEWFSTAARHYVPMFLKGFLFRQFSGFTKACSPKCEISLPYPLFLTPPTWTQELKSHLPAVHTVGAKRFEHQRSSRGEMPRKHSSNQARSLGDVLRLCSRPPEQDPSARRGLRVHTENILQ
jgi:hypothetical protein